MSRIKFQEGSIYRNGYGIVAKKVMLDTELGTTAKALYALLCTYANPTEGKKAYPSINFMSDKLDIHKDTLYKYLNQLIEKDYIRKHKQKEKGKFARNEYEVVLIPEYSPFPNSSDTVSSDTENPETINTSSNNTSTINTNKKYIGVSIDNSHLPFTSGYQLMKYFVDERKRLHNKDTKLTREKWQEYHNQFDSELHCRVGSKEGHININKDMIDTYMNRQFIIEIDYSIAHFLSGGIISILAVEEGLI